MNLEAIILESELQSSSSSIFSTIFYYLLIVLSLFLLICYWWKQSERFVKLGNRLSGSISLPIIGSCYEFIGKTNIEIMEDKILNTENYLNISRDWIGSKLIIYLNHPDDIDLILNSRSQKDKDNFIHKSEIINKNLIRFISIFENKSKKLVEKMKCEVGQTFDVYEYMRRIVADIIIATTFGCNNTHRDDLNYSMELKKNCDLIEQRQLKSYLNYDKIFNFPRLLMPTQKNLASEHDLTGKIVKQRRIELAEAIMSDDNNEIDSYKIAMDEFLENNYGYNNVKIITDDLVSEFEIHIKEMTGGKSKRLKNIIANGNYEGKMKIPELNIKQKLPTVPLDELKEIKLPLPELGDLIGSNFKEYNKIIQEIHDYENYLKANSKSMKLKEIIKNGNFEGKCKPDYTKNQYIPQEFQQNFNSLAMNETIENNYGYKNVRLITENLTEQFQNVINSIICEPISLKEILKNGNYEGKKKQFENKMQKLPTIPIDELKQIKVPLPDLGEVISSTFIEYNETIEEIYEYENYLKENSKSMRLKDIIESGNFDGKYKANNQKNQYIPQNFKECPQNNDNKYSLTILDSLIKSANNNYFSNQEITKQIDTIITEGYDTMAIASSFVLSLLGQHPDIQEKVYNELKRIFKNSSREMTYADINSMEYLEQVIKETLRMYPPIPLIIKNIHENIYLISEDHIVPGGSTVVISIFRLHRRPEYYKNPNVFNPDNFSKKNIQKRPKSSYIPFGVGSCIGEKYSLLKLKVIISTILRNYKIKTNENEMKLEADIVLTNTNGFNIEIESRN